MKSPTSGLKNCSVKALKLQIVGSFVGEAGQGEGPCLMHNPQTNKSEKSKAKKSLQQSTS